MPTWSEGDKVAGARAPEHEPRPELLAHRRGRRQRRESGGIQSASRLRDCDLVVDTPARSAGEKIAFSRAGAQNTTPKWPQSRARGVARPPRAARARWYHALPVAKPRSLKFSCNLVIFWGVRFCFRAWGAAPRPKPRPYLPRASMGPLDESPQPSGSVFWIEDFLLGS